MAKILEARSVHKEYNNGIISLKNINLEFTEGNFVVLLGHSGSGKSTLLNVLSSILTPTSGQILYQGKDLGKMNKNQIAYLRRNEIGFVFQSYLIFSNLTVMENILLGDSSKTNIKSCEEISEFLGIKILLDKYPDELSGGEQQRVAIARAVIKKPKIIFCDEATGALDEFNSRKVVEFLHEIKNMYGTTILFSTHNTKIAETADRVIVIKDGTITKDYINNEPLKSEHMSWEIK